MINAIIIDDEPAQRQVIKSLINSKYPDISVVAEADKVNGSSEIIIQQKPDLLFLDVELKDGISFEILRRLTYINFKIIFITGYSKYAIDALKFSALDYILKPLKTDEFFSAVNKAVSEISIKSQLFKIENLIQNLNSGNNQTQKIVLKTQEGTHLLKISDIIRCESYNSYVTFFTSDGKKIMITSSLAYYEEMLADYNFFRVHQTHLINMQHVECFQKKNGGFILLSNKSIVPLSQRKKSEFLEKLHKTGI